MKNVSKHPLVWRSPVASPSAREKATQFLPRREWRKWFQLEMHHELSLDEGLIWKSNKGTFINNTCYQILPPWWDFGFKCNLELDRTKLKSLDIRREKNESEIRIRLQALSNEVLAMPLKLMSNPLTLATTRALNWNAPHGLMLFVLLHFTLHFQSDKERIHLCNEGIL